LLHAALTDVPKYIDIELEIGVLVGVAVGVSVGVAVGVEVGVSVGVEVGVGSNGVEVGVLVGVGSKGVAVGLESILKLEDGESLGGGTVTLQDAIDAFSDEDDLM